MAGSDVGAHAAALPSDGRAAGGKPGFAYEEVVRGKAAREQLRGFACHDCDKVSQPGVVRCGSARELLASRTVPRGWLKVLRVPCPLRSAPPSFTRCFRATSAWRV